MNALFAGFCETASSSKASGEVSKLEQQRVPAGALFVWGVSNSDLKEN